MRYNVVPNTGSTARDFCMLERNLLSHLKLALLLSLLSSSLLLRTRLVPEPEGTPSKAEDSISLPLSGVELAASLATVVAGAWGYFTGYRDLRDMRAFLVGVKYGTHFVHVQFLNVQFQKPTPCHNDCCCCRCLRDLHCPSRCALTAVQCSTTCEFLSSI